MFSRNKWKVIAKYSSFYGYILDEDQNTPQDERGIALLYDGVSMRFARKDIEPWWE